MQRYCSGRLPIPVDNARDLIRFVVQKNPKDIELLEFFCPPGYLPTQTVEHSKSIENTQEKELELSVLNGKSIEAIEDANKDGIVDKQEAKRTHKLLTRLRQVAAELDARMMGKSKK